MSHQHVIPKCPRCYAQVADWLLCARCTDQVVADLRRIADLYSDLQDTITGQVSMGDGGKMNERPLPFKEKAVKAATYVKNQLSSWVRDLDMGDTQWSVERCTCKPYRPCRGFVIEHLADTVEAMANWLIERVQRIRSSAASDEIAGEFDYCVKIMLPIVDRPAELQFCGKCAVCAKDLYSRRGQAEGVCQHCRASGVETVYDPQARRDLVLARLEHHWGTITECTRVLLNYGLDVSAQTLKDWTRPNAHGLVRLDRRGENQLGHALYRFGDVMTLAQERKTRLEEKKGKQRVA